MKFFTKLICGLLVCSLVVQYIHIDTLSRIAFSNNHLVFSLDEAIKRSIEIDSEMVIAKTELRQKELEYKEALRNIQQQAFKDASLFAEPRNLTQDIEFRMKIPQTSKKLKEATAKIVSLKRTIGFDVERMYLSTVQAMLQTASAEKKVKKKLDELKDIKTKERIGLAKKEELEQAQEAMEAANSEMKLAQLAYKSKRISLGKRTGINLESGYSFSYEPEYVNMNQALMWNLIYQAEQNDFALNKAIEDRRIAEQQVNLTRSLYRNKFGETDMKIIESMYTSEAIDYDEYMANHENLLAQIEESWEGFIFLGLFWLPKSFFQGKYEGLRYFDDVLLSLPVSTMEWDKQKLKEKKAKEDLISSIQASHLDTKSAEENYAQALIALDKAKNKKKTEDIKFRNGLINKEKWQEIEEEVLEKEEQVVGTLFAYKFALIQLNTVTSGALTPHIRQGILPYRNIEDGLEPTVEPERTPPIVSGTWELTPIVEDLTSEFKVTMTGKLEATHFQLLTQDGKTIGEHIPLGEKLIHLHFIFLKLEDLKVYFYKDSEKVAEALLNGYGTTGALKISLGGEKR